LCGELSGLVGHRLERPDLRRTVPTVVVAENGATTGRAV
jgi:hypothetical protein